MKCNICDRQLGVDEIKLHPEMKTWEPCGTCLEAISEVFEHDFEEEIETTFPSEYWLEAAEFVDTAPSSESP